MVMVLAEVMATDLGIFLVGVVRWLSVVLARSCRRRMVREKTECGIERRETMEMIKMVRALLCAVGYGLGGMNMYIYF